MAKRVNTRFLIILTAVFACLIAAAVVAKMTVFRKDPRANEAAGDNAVKEGQYKQAVEFYRFAIASSKNANGLLVKTGDALNMMVADDPQNLYNARAAWNQALANDPKFEPALQRLLDSYWEHMEISPPEVALYTRVRETAQRLADVRPGDLKVQAKAQIATVRPWLEGLPARTQDVTDAVAALKKLIDRDPADAETRFYFALAKLKISREKHERGDPKDTGEAERFAAAEVFDGVLQDPPKDAVANAGMQVRAYQVYSRLDQIEKAIAAEAERRGSSTVIAIDPGTDDAKTPGGKKPGDFAAKAEKALAAAVEAAKALPPENDLYFEVSAQAAESAMRKNRPADAEKIFEEVIAKRPEDQKARLAYARLLGQQPAKRDKAVEVLSREVKLSRLVGPKGSEANRLHAETIAERVGIKIDQARALAASPQAQESSTTTAKQRQDLIADIRGDMKLLEPLIPGESAPVLHLKARVLQLEGKTADSIQTFQRAVTLMEGSSQERKGRDYYDMVNELAVAYLQAGQTGSAKELLKRIIDRYDWYVPARLQMALLLVNENKLGEAKLQMREAEKQLAKIPGDSAEYPRIRAEFDRAGLIIMTADKDPRLNDSFAKLPESTRAERLNKALVARQISRNGDAIRLAGSAVKDDPKDLSALEVLLQALLAEDRRQEAVAALEVAMAANPDKVQRLQPAYDSLKAATELANASPQQIYERRKQLIQSEPETPARFLKLADLEREYGHAKEAEAILAEQHRKNPADMQVVSRQFDLAISRQKWPEAQSYLDKLVAANADEAGGLLFQYRFAMSQKNTPEGLRLAKALVKASPEFDVSWVAYGQALQADRRYAEAIKQYQFARQRKPLNTDALRGMIECYGAQNQPEKAREVLNEARALFPNDPHFRDLDLQNQLDYGDPMAAVAQCEQLQRERPQDADRWLKLAMAYRAAANAKADATRADLQAKARDLLQKGAAKWDGDGRFVAQQADLALEAGDAAGGEKLLQAYAARPDRQKRADAQMLLAVFYYKANKLDEAEAAYGAALKRVLDPAAPPAGDKPDASAPTATASDIRLKLSGLLAQRRKFDEALKVLDDADAAAAGGGTTPAPGGAAAVGDRQLLNQRLTVLIMAGRRDLAEKVLSDAVAKGNGAEDAGLQMMLVRVNYDGGRYDEALNRVTKILKADPENIEGHFYRGQILLRKPQPDLAGAISELGEVRKADARHAPTRILLADAYRQQGDTPKAIRELEEGLSTDPLNRELRLRLMDYRSTEGSLDLNDVLRLAGEARAHPQLKDDPIWAVRESRVWADRRDWPKAIAAIEDASRLAPADISIVREYQTVLLAAQNYKAVLDQTDRLVKENRAPWWALMNRAAARSGLQDTAGAMTEFNLALTAAGPDNTAVEQIVKTMTNTVGKEKAIEQVMARAGTDVRWKLLGAALYSIYKDWDQAVKMLDDVQAHFPELDKRQQAQALRISGPLYQLARPPQLDKAKSAYEQLLKLEPKDLFALNNLATLLVDDSIVPQPQRAKEYSGQAYELVKRAQPFPAAIWDTHGWVLVQCGGSDLEEGIGILQRVVRQTSLPEAHYHLGEAYLKKQDARKALEELKVAADSINQAPERGIAVAPDLEKRIQAANDRAKELLRTQSGGEAVAQ